MDVNLISTFDGHVLAEVCGSYSINTFILQGIQLLSSAGPFYTFLLMWLIFQAGLETITAHKQVMKMAVHSLINYTDKSRVTYISIIQPVTTAEITRLSPAASPSQSIKVTGI